MAGPLDYLKQKAEEEIAKRLPTGATRSEQSSASYQQEEDGVRIAPIKEAKPGLKKGEKAPKADPYAPKPVPLFGATVETAYGVATFSAPAAGADGILPLVNVEIDFNRDGIKDKITATREGTLTVKTPGKPDASIEGTDLARALVAGGTAFFESGKVTRVESDALAAEAIVGALSVVPNVPKAATQAPATAAPKR